MKITKRRLLASIMGLIIFWQPAMAQLQADGIPRSTQVQRLENWMLSHRGDSSGLPLSHVGDERFRNWCFTYDAAVAALSLIALDRPLEARRIIDFYISTKHTHRLGGVIEAVTVIPPYGGMDWTVRTGANLWLGLAAFHLFNLTDDHRYLAFAARIADFALGLQDRDAAGQDVGGIRLGPPGDPAVVGDQHFAYDPDRVGFEEVISTEATIDAFALFNLLQAEPAMERFRSGRDRCLRWLKKVAWNPDDQRFNRGFGKAPDFSVASDIQAWGVSALGVARLNTIQTGAAEGMIRFVERHCQSTVSYKRPDGVAVTVKGFDFVDHAALAYLKRTPLVSTEWTFQMANAYKRLADDFNGLGESRKAIQYAQKREALLSQMMAMASINDNAAGFPYATLADAPIGHEHRTPAKGNLSMIGVTYGILALTGYDPLRVPGDP